MNRHQKKPHLKFRSPAWRPAFERLDAALEENTRPDPDEIGRILRGEPENERPAGSSSQHQEVYPGKSG
jgi:hypothetical protein